MVSSRPPRRDPLKRSDRLRLLADQHIEYGIDLYHEAERVESEELSRP